MNNPLETAEIEGTDLKITRLGLGGASLNAFRFDVDESRKMVL
jgi:hypothetical protein